MQPEIKEIRAALKRNILRNGEFAGHEALQKQIFDLLQRTIVSGESNSALLIGPKGAGKTLLINHLIGRLSGLNYFKSDAILVKLNGLVHTDDRLALKSVTSQMHLENAVDGKVFGSFAENLAFLLACLRSGERRTSKSIVFVLEEFDLFCNHHNQTLLYNLFDVSQSAQAPICVLGVTCRLDVIELLEKRVKSRFSHRQFFLFPAEDDADVLEHTLRRIEAYLRVPETSKACKQWNSKMAAVYKDKKFKAAVSRLVDLDVCEGTLKNILIAIVASLSDGKPHITADNFCEQINLLVERDSSVQVLQDLSALELCLVVAMKHHAEIYADGADPNFEMVLTRYTKFANAHANVQTSQRAVVMKAFEHLEDLEIISRVAGGGIRAQKEYQPFKLLVTPQQIGEAVKGSPGLPTEVVQWANSSLA